MAKGTFAVKPFAVAADDPLAAEHEAVARWTEEALKSTRPHAWYEQTDLKSLDSGKVFLDAKPEQARRFLLAAIAQTKHWDLEAERVRSQGKSEMERINAHMLPGWDGVWGRRRQAAAVIIALMRRALPLEKSDLLTILDWSALQISTYHTPFGAITKALERYAAEHSIEPDLLRAMRDFAARVRASHDKDVKKHGTTVEQLCAGGDAEVAPPAPDARNVQATPKPAPAGNPAVMPALKRYLDVAPAGDDVATTAVGPDRFHCAKIRPCGLSTSCSRGCLTKCSTRSAPTITRRSSASARSGNRSSRWTRATAGGCCLRPRSGTSRRC